jgi:hypothetical protein
LEQDIVDIGFIEVSGFNFLSNWKRTYNVQV